MTPEPDRKAVKHELDDYEAAATKLLKEAEIRVLLADAELIRQRIALEPWRMVLRYMWVFAALMSLAAVITWLVVSAR